MVSSCSLWLVMPEETRKPFSSPGSTFVTLSTVHSAVLTTLQHMGLPHGLIELVRNAYTNATTAVRTDAGLTEDIPILAGVKQGCLLSLILFNLTLELVLRKVKAASSKGIQGPARHHGKSLSVLAYADDLVLISKRQDNLTTLLNTASAAATTIGLEFRQDKCASISIVKQAQGRMEVVPTAFQIQQQIMPALTAEEHYRYLGIPIGLIHNADNLPVLVERLIPELERIESSLLAPWQKLDAIRTFIQPSLTYALRAGCPLKQSMEAYWSTLV